LKGRERIKAGGEVVERGAMMVIAENGVKESEEEETSEAAISKSKCECIIDAASL